MPTIWVKLRIDGSEATCQRRSQVSSIHLFMQPFITFSSKPFHFWSLDKDGQTQISKVMCKQLGLPTKLEITEFSFDEQFWTSKVYKDFYNWQVLRRFNPETNAFSKYLGYPSVFRPLYRKS